MGTPEAGPPQAGPHGLYVPDGPLVPHDLAFDLAFDLVEAKKMPQTFSKSYVSGLLCPGSED